MSILLNALKKSEAQRQLGQTPGIHTPLDLSSEGAVSEQQWLPLSMMVLSAIAIAWIVWNQYREPLPEQTATTVVSAPADRQGGDSVRAPAEAAAGRTPVESFQEEQPSLAGNAAPAASPPPDAEQRKQKLNENFSSYEGAEKPADQVQSETSKPVESKKSPDSAAVVAALAETRQAAPAPEPAKKETKPMVPSIPEPISFWQVPQSVRDSLPEFKVSVLVYAEVPEERFLVVNGVRLVEKGELAAGCVLDEIRRDGAVFTYKKYRFLVKG